MDAFESLWLCKELQSSWQYLFISSYLRFKLSEKSCNSVIPSPVPPANPDILSKTDVVSVEYGNDWLDFNVDVVVIIVVVVFVLAVSLITDGVPTNGDDNPDVNDDVGFDDNDITVTVEDGKVEELFVEDDIPFISCNLSVLSINCCCLWCWRWNSIEWLFCILLKEYSIDEEEEDDDEDDDDDDLDIFGQ